MRVTPLSPLGVKVEEFDLRDTSQRKDLFNLVMHEGLVLVRSKTAPEGAPKLDEPENLSILGNGMGRVTDYHPINEIGAYGVQDIDMNGPGGRKPDSYEFHNDTCCFVRPVFVSIMSPKLLPVTKGVGATRFLNGSQAYKRLPQHLRDRIKDLNCFNSYRTSYKEMDDEYGHVSFKREDDDIAVHPAVITHPFTKEPVLYLTHGMSLRIVGMSQKETDALLKEVYDIVYDAEASIYTHHWEMGDIILWDDVGMQHQAPNDYTERRILRRIQAAYDGFRTDRYVPPELSVDFLSLLKADTKDTEENAYHYEHFALLENYNINASVANILEEYVPNGKVLDVGAGTGLLGLELLRSKETFVCDYIDVSQKMRLDADRRNLYDNKVTGDVNDGMPFDNEKYQAVVSICATGKNQIIPSSGVKEMIRVLAAGGIFVIVHYVDDNMISDIVRECEVEVIENKAIQLTSNSKGDDGLLVVARKI